MTFAYRPLDLSSIINYLSAISSIAVILGAIFVVFQLRQNAKLIELTIHENRSSIAFALLEKITDETFAARRKKMHNVIKHAQETNWVGFDDSLDDFEARNFAYIYELIGQLTQDNIVDLRTIRNALQYLVVTDWEAFAPLSKRLIERFHLNVNPWGSFEWLADETRRHMMQKQQLPQNQ
jgi:hypothetical protein